MSDYDCIQQRIIKMEGKLEATNETLESHRDTLEAHNRRLSDLTNSLHENTELTQQIADNTKEMVGMFKEAKVVFKWGTAARKFLIWTASIAAGFAYFWHSIVDWIKQ